MTTTSRSTATPTITERLAEHVTSLRFDDIPRPVINRAKALLAHHLGAALRGHETPSGRQAVRVALELSGGGGDCSIVGAAQSADLLEAIFANSFLMTAAPTPLDVLIPQGVYPGVITHPVAWAVGEANKVSGRELLVAVIVGYDVASRVADPAWGFGPDVVDRPALYRPKHILAPLGAAATAARLLGLSPEQVVHALGHAGQTGMGIIEAPPEQAITLDPLLARNGTMAALLARAGIPATATILEGRHGVFRSFFFHDTTEFIQAGLATLGQEFAISQAVTKKQMASAMDVVPMELTQHLVDQHALTASTVAAVDVTLPVEREPREAVREETLFGPDAGPMSRVGNLRFQLAIIIADGHTDPARFEHAPDADLFAVLDMVRLHFEADRPRLYARVDVTTTDGRHHRVEGDTLETSTPPNWEQTLAECGRALLTHDQLAHLTGLIHDLENVSDVSELMACATPGRSS